MLTTLTSPVRFLLMKHLRLLASINAGWLRQNDPFVPTRLIRYCWREPALCRPRVCTERSKRWQ